MGCLNFALRQVVKLGNNATIAFYNRAGYTDLVVDLVGYYSVSVLAPGTFHLGPPTRVAR